MAGAGVVVDGVMGLRLGQAQGVFLVAQRDAVPGVGQHLQHVLDVHLARRAVAQAALELCAVDPFGQQGTGGSVDTGDVGEVQPVGCVPCAEFAVAHGVDGTGALRPAAQPHVFIGIEGERGAGVVHQVAAHHVAAVGQALGELGALGQQQQPRAFDAVGRNDEGLARDAVRHFVGVVVVHCRDACGAIVLQLEHVGIGLEFGARCQGCIDGQSAVVLGVDGANRLAAVVAAAGRASVVAAAVARRGVAHHRVDGRQPFAQALHGPGFGHGLHGKGLGARRAGVGCARDTHDLFGFLVVGFQFVVAERPVHAHAVQAVDAEIVGHIAPGMGGPVPAGSAHLPDVLGLVGVGAGMHQMAVVFGLVDRMRCPGCRWVGRHPVAAAR